MKTLSTVVLVAFASGCRPAVDVADPSPFEEDDPAAVAAAEQRELSREAPAVERAEAAAPADGPITGEVARAELIAVLDLGVGALLKGGIEVNPRLDLRNRFLGWEVVRFSYRWADLRPGDVVSAINGRPIGKPTEVQELWDSLRTADEIVVRGERDGTPFVLRFAIVGAAPVGVARAKPDRSPARSEPR